MKIFLKTVLWVFAAALAAFVAFAGAAAIADYRPDAKEPVREMWGSGETVADTLPDTLKIVTWNIGYGGLGDDMDFFYDGGSRVRCSEGRTFENLSGIIAALKAADADIYLLQEVDECSRRSYRIRELELLKEAFPGYHLYFAYNYKSLFVPVPLSEPMGKVASGLVMLSRFRPESVERLAYPSRFPFPVSMFNLKRCLLAATFLTSDGTRVMIGNTHNTAYDTGDMRTRETAFLVSLADSLSLAGIRVVIGGDWNQYPPEYVPSEAELDNACFSVVPLDVSGLDAYGRIVSDPSEKTLRYLDLPFGDGPAQSVTDYYYVSYGLEASPAEVCGNEGFRFSDHKPVKIDIVL